MATWVHDYAPPIRGMVLATSAFRVKLYIPFAIAGLRLLQKLTGKAFIKSYVKSTMLTHDAEQTERYTDDELISRNIAVNILLDLFDTSTRLLDDAGAIHTPTLLMAAGSDWVVKLAPQKCVFDKLSSERKEFVTLPGFYHAVFHEKERDEAIAKVRDFIMRLFDEPPQPVSLLNAHQRGYTFDEHQRLSRPPGLLRGCWFAAQRAAMKSIGRLSKGVRLGWEAGFDSGRTLDHVYENRAQGTTPLGKLIDRNYLNAIGWQGIRQRKVHLKKLLRIAIAYCRSAGKPIRLLDIAAGPGRYMLETLQELADGSSRRAIACCTRISRGIRSSK